MIAAAATGTAEFTGLVGLVVDVIEAIGPLGVALLIALDNIVPVIPSEVILPFAGYLAGRGDMDVFSTFVAATIGSVASAYVYYEVGRGLGRDRARAALLRVPLMNEDDIDRAFAWFDRHGNAAVLTGRCVPFIRSVVSLPAGTAGMGRARFGVLTAVGSGVWNAIWLALGMAVGRSWHEAGRYSSWLNWGTAVVVVALVARYVWRRRDRLPNRS